MAGFGWMWYNLVNGEVIKHDTKNSDFGGERETK